jgi:hypothetical protein
LPCCVVASHNRTSVAIILTDYPLLRLFWEASLGLGTRLFTGIHTHF